MSDARYIVRITGIVQGVGFRPFIYTLAKSLFLNGWVKNTGASVTVEIEGRRDNLNQFMQSVKRLAPPLSNIRNISFIEKEIAGYDGFFIIESDKPVEPEVYISPDVSICQDCMDELLDKSNRRFLYPFINCTNCGPRFTITIQTPYDRCNTTMSKFTMCKSCASEYQNPSDRRYHAQPIACFHCGPTLSLLDSYGNELNVSDAIGFIKEQLSKGSIVALKGLGGYHLTCDAKNKNALENLRQRKARDEKPFALMMKEYDTAIRYCFINTKERELLEGNKKPIVLLKKRQEIELPEEISYTNPYYGVMLPYTPLHMLLFTDYPVDRSRVCNSSTPPLDVLVMTSGNRGGEPIYFEDKDAVENLWGIADYFLTYDRDIYIRTDDSVTRVFKDREYIIRRSRGYVPMPVNLECILKDTDENKPIPSVLACGGELKNTFCLNKGTEFYISHHIGDLENFETLTSFENGIKHFQNTFNINEKCVAFDLHPEYLSTKYALDLDIDQKFSIQHHHAHMASCMAENGICGPVIGVIFDGTGYGTDGHLWGGEFLVGGYDTYERAAHLEYIKMPGGEAAIREPWRMAVSYLNKALEKGPKDLAQTSRAGYFDILKGIGAEKSQTIVELMGKNINCPFTSSMGRLFDAVSSLLGLKNSISYEGQAAIELEYIASMDYTGEYDFELNTNCTPISISVDSVIRGVVEDIRQGLPNTQISSKFHETVANIVLTCCSNIYNCTNINQVVLSGGVYQNITLLSKCVLKLEAAGFQVYTHSILPSNDGGISLGQAVIAVKRLLKSGV